MPGENRISSRLDTLLDSILEPHPDPFSLYWEIAAELRPEQNASAQQRIRRSLRKKRVLTTDSALLAACVLHLTGLPTERILDFLSRRVTTPVTIPQFELAVAAIFIGDPPVSPELLYDLTQYTYLEKRLLVQKGLEISAKLKDRLSPEVLLYLYLLSLRGDLSNENVQLIVLIMKNSFPDVDVPARLDGEKERQYGEIARAWKKAEEASHADNPVTVGRGEAPADTDRNSASAFLDKYYADTDADAPQRQGEGKAAARPPAEKRKTLSKGAPDRGAPRHAAPRRAPGTSRAVAKTARTTPARRTPARRAPSVAEPPAPVLSPPETAGAVRLPFMGAPFLLAVLVAFAAALLVGRVVAAPLPAVAAPRPVEAPALAPASASMQQAAQPASSAPAARTYVVRPGDSLWKIFHSLGPEGRGGASWRDFLSGTRAVNDLGDPDLIHPGAVLRITPQDR